MDATLTKRAPKPKKIEAVKEIAEKVDRAKAIYFTEYRGLTVEEITQLRRQCFKNNIEYSVSKNTFARMVLKERGYDDSVLKNLVGPTAMAFGYTDPAAAAKILFDFAAANEKLVLKGGIFDGKGITAKDFEAIKDLPSREQCLAMLFAAINGPVQGFVNVLSAVLRDFVSVVDQIAEKKKAA